MTSRSLDDKVFNVKPLNIFLIPVMEWSTIPNELLERILILTASPQAVSSACRTCKGWHAIDSDAHLWKLHTDTAVNWKQKVVDYCLIRRNIKDGKCVVRNLLTAPIILPNDHTLEFDNFSLYKDYCLVNWKTVGGYDSSGADIVREDSVFINLINAEVTRSDLQEALFLNHYVANSPSDYYGRASFKWVKAKKFDPDSISYIAFNRKDIKLNVQGTGHESVINNYCPDSNFLGFLRQNLWFRQIVVFDAETGKQLIEREEKAVNFWVRMYDNYLALCDVHSGDVTVTDVLTQQEWKRKCSKQSNNTMSIGFMTGYEIVIQADQIIVWNFTDNTEVVYPIGQVKHPIRMIYNGMWLVYDEAKLYFYDMTNGSLVNNIALRQCSSKYISLLSDGRLGVVQRVGCRVISFIDSEVNRMIEVDLMDVDGSITHHEIPAHQLAQFFVDKANKDYEHMTSCVLSSYGEKITFESDDERFVMLFSCFGRDETLNNAATELLKKAKKGCFNVPYQGWKFNDRSITASDWKNNIVFGSAIIVREQKIDGRWQLVSIS